MLFPDVASLLRAHGISAPETPLDHGGFSGARISRIEQDGRRFILKRMRYEDDWIMQRTNDVACREAAFAVSALAQRLPVGVASPSLGACHDGDGFGLLMRDLGPYLLPDDAAVSSQEWERVFTALAALHAAFWDAPLDDVPWCDPADRLLFLTPDAGKMLRAREMDFGVADGWKSFAALATNEALELVQRLFADVTPLTRALESLPNTLVHGDVKIANVALDDERVWFFDWSFVSHAPVAADLGWMMAVNSSRLPMSLDEALSRYRGHLANALDEATVAATWERQRAAACISGLLILGWGKSGDQEELRWWCDNAVAAARLLGV
jgi:aminoglycoside phosphotransferase (APT) family kinase protein